MFVMVAESHRFADSKSLWAEASPHPHIGCVIDRLYLPLDLTDEQSTAPLIKNQSFPKPSQAMLVSIRTALDIMLHDEQLIDLGYRVGARILSTMEQIDICMVIPTL
jgi:hypothetical protein